MEKGKLSTAGWIALAILFVDAILLMIDDVWQDWANSAISDLPLPFWALYGVLTVVMFALLVTTEIPIWSRWYQKSSPLPAPPPDVALNIGWVLLLVMMLVVLLFTGYWTGPKVLLVTLATVFLLQSVSAIARWLVMRPRT